MIRYAVVAGLLLVGCSAALDARPVGEAVDQIQTSTRVQVQDPKPAASLPVTGSVKLDRDDPDFMWFDAAHRRVVKSRLPDPLTARMRVQLVYRDDSKPVPTLRGAGSGKFVDQLGEPVEFGYVVDYQRGESGGWELAGATVSATDLGLPPSR